MKEAPGADAILIDLDGVIRFWPRPFDQAVVPGQHQVEDDVFTVAFAPDLLGSAITGRITHDEWLAETVRLLIQAWPVDRARQAVAAWADSLPTIEPVVRELVAEWRRSVPVVLVTNATDRLARDLVLVGLGDAFDAIVNSSGIGHAKPAQAIFTAAIGTVGVPADRTIFIDDTLTNVEAARELGLLGYHFDGDVDRLSQFVDQRLA